MCGGRIYSLYIDVTVMYIEPKTICNALHLALHFVEWPDAGQWTERCRHNEVE